MRKVVLFTTLFLFLVGCGKTVRYTTPELPEPVNCVNPTGCTTPGGDKNTNSNPPSQPLELVVFLESGINHNVDFCASIAIEGMTSFTSLGCLPGQTFTVNYWAQTLLAPGDTARFEVFYSYQPSQNASILETDFYTYPGHYKICQTTGSQVWVEFEDHLGVPDYNDSKIIIESVSGEDLEIFQGQDGFLYIKWVD